MNPKPTTPARELQGETPHEQLKRREQSGADEATAPDAAICKALLKSGSLRNEDLAKTVGFQGSSEEWKRLLWRLHNEGYLKVRWVGLADPDPVEVRLTNRGRAWIKAEPAGPLPAGQGHPRSDENQSALG